MTRDSSYASRSPTLKPWPATGCSVCAALPMTTVRLAAGRGTNSSTSGKLRRSATRTKRPARGPKCPASRARNAASSSASSSAARPGLAVQTSPWWSASGSSATGPSGGEALEREPRRRAVDPDAGDERRLAVVVPPALEAGHDGAGAVGDDRQPGEQRVGLAFDVDGGVRRRPAHRADARVPAHADAAARERGVERALKREVADDVAERGNARVGRGQPRGTEAARLRDVDVDDRRHRTALRREWRSRRRAARAPAARRATAPASGRRAASRPRGARRRRRRRGRRRRRPAQASRRPVRRRR